MIAPPSWLTFLLTPLTGLVGAWLEVGLIGRAWDFCEVGINAAANSLTLIYVGLPVLAVVNCVVFALAFRFSYAGAIRGVPAVAAGTAAFLAAILALGLVLWAVMAISVSGGGYCPRGTPGWWPSWLPI